jgi:hypothetical protein
VVSAKLGKWPATDDPGPFIPVAVVKIGLPLTWALTVTKLMVLATLKSIELEFADKTEVAEIEKVDVLIKCPDVPENRQIWVSILLAGPVTIGLLFDKTDVATRLMVFATLKSMLEEFALKTEVAALENVDVLKIFPVRPLNTATEVSVEVPAFVTTFALTMPLSWSNLPPVLPNDGKFPLATETAVFVTTFALTMPLS